MSSAGIAAPRVACDIGNSRMKWGLLDASGSVIERAALAPDDPESWAATIARWGLDRQTSWAISSVRPASADALGRLLDSLGTRSVRWFRSAADVPMPTRVRHPDRSGADRALAALAASSLFPRGHPGLVVSCGTAITVERISAEGVWEGGAIALGMGLAARTLHERTAQLPHVLPTSDPEPWGDSTVPALEAGIFWGTIGAVRELIARQGPLTWWRVWTGGDADRIAAHVEDDPGANPLVPDLVLIGLAIAAFGIAP